MKPKKIIETVFREPDTSLLCDTPHTISTSINMGLTKQASLA